MFNLIRFMLVFFCFMQLLRKQLQHQMKKQQLFHQVKSRITQARSQDNRRGLLVLIKADQISFLLICFIKLTLLFGLFLFPTGESTSAPGEETTAVPQGKTLNNMEKEKKKII